MAIQPPTTWEQWVQAQPPETQLQAAVISYLRESLPGWGKPKSNYSGIAGVGVYIARNDTILFDVHGTHKLNLLAYCYKDHALLIEQTASGCLSWPYTYSNPEFPGNLLAQIASREELANSSSTVEP